MTVGATRTVLVIMGMRDNTCRELIADTIGRIKGVSNVHVSLIRARAIIDHAPALEPTELVRAVVMAGYSAVVYGRGE